VEEDRARLAAELDRALAGASPGPVAADDGGRAAQLAARVGELEAQRLQDASELKRTEEERARLAGELERALAAKPSAPAAVAGDKGGRAAEIAARVEELEAQRRQDVSELQRLQEALANTQHELTAATKKAKQAESSARRLQAVEATDGTSENEAPDDVAQARSERRSRTAKAAEELFAQSEEETIATRLSRAKGQKGGVDPGEAGEPEPEAAAAAAPSGGLSLKERLARAAAARHRAPGSADEAEER